MARKKSDQSSGAPEETKKQKKQKKPGRFKQIWQVFQMTRKYDPATPWWMLLIILGVGGLAVGLGFIIDVPGGPIYTGVLGIPFGLLGAMFLLTRRAEVAAYARIEGQPGAVGAALGTIRRGWTVEEQPVAINPRTQDMVFRAIGRPGVALISEGPVPRVNKILDPEVKRVARLLPGVPVMTFQVGDGEGQVPLRKIAMKIQRQRPKLSKMEAAEVMRRLKALGGVQLPIPKGVDPTKARPDRRGMRGR